MNDAKLATIRGLLAKAESTEFEGERDALNAKAQELISRYGIDEALLAAESTERSTVGERFLVVEGSYLRDKRQFLHAIYTALNCQTFALDHGRFIKVTVFGYDSDLDRAELLYTSLLLQAMTGMKDPKLTGWSGPATMANRRVWLLGFRQIVRARIVEAERRATVEAQEDHPGTSTALVIRDRAALVKNAYDEFVDEFKSDGGKVRHSRSTYSGRGYALGKAAGQRADIGGKRVGGSRAALR